LPVANTSQTERLCEEGILDAPDIHLAPLLDDLFSSASTFEFQ
jgi:hypothetical protein